MNTTTNQDKPVSVIIADAKQALVETINTLQLSPTILDFIIRDIAQEIQRAAQDEYRRDTQFLSEMSAEQDSPNADN